MKISEIGGEFALISRLSRRDYSDPAIIRGVGDDCAVIAHTAEKHLLVTTDMMVEDSHFKAGWANPFQVGKKLMEVNVSDIVSMGGTPTYAFISLALTKDTEVEYMDELYRGIYASADKHGVALIGGDTTSGAGIVLNIALLGEVEKDLLCLRSDAKPGDLICVTGTLGKSAAGLYLLLAGKSGYLKGYQEPECRLVSEGRIIAKRAHAMIDVSDGLASEVGHICEESGTGARIDHASIPLSADTREAARAVSMDPYDFALNGGEDFELVFTLPPGEETALRKEFSDFTVVGEILKKSDGLFILKDGKREELKGGFNHFAK